MKRIMEERNINSLFHFTQASNLKSILERGIMPTPDLDVLGIVYHHNDEHRHDKCPEAVCTSIEFPNYKMFCNVRGRHYYDDIDWVVIQLDARIIHEMPCAFCWTNASDAAVSTIPIEQRMGRDAFEDLFTDHPNKPKREQLNIPDCYPTNPQAEVLVFGTIPVEYIKCIYFRSKFQYNKYRDVIPQTIDFSWDDDYFYPRKDWMHW